MDRCYTTGFLGVLRLQQKRISISISPQIKEQIEQLAKRNYRTLNGEINKALDWYVLNQGDGELVKTNTLTTPTHDIETSIEPQTKVDQHLNAPIYTNNNQYDEVEEF